MILILFRNLIYNKKNIIWYFFVGSWILFIALVVINIVKLVAHTILGRMPGDQEPEEPEGPVNMDPPEIPQVQLIKIKSSIYRRSE